MEKKIIYTCEVAGNRDEVFGKYSNKCSTECFDPHYHVPTLLAELEGLKMVAEIHWDEDDILVAHNAAIERVKQLVEGK